jgi:hypothetical protein
MLSERTKSARLAIGSAFCRQRKYFSLGRFSAVPTLVTRAIVNPIMELTRVICVIAGEYEGLAEGMKRARDKTTLAPSRAATS